MTPWNKIPDSLIPLFRRIKRGAVPLLIAILGGMATWEKPALAKVPADMLVVGITIDDIVSLDPAQAFEITGVEIIGNIYERLVAIDPQNPDRIVPGLAQSWVTSPDGLETRFSLRPDVVFASGHPVTAQDAAWSLQRLITLNKSPAFILGQFGFTPENVARHIYAEGDNTLVIRTRTPFAPNFLLSCLTSWATSILDRRKVQAKASDDDLGNKWLSKHSAGSGPFVLTAWRPKEYVILEANPAYREGKPPMQRVVFQHIGESATQRLMLDKGDIDIARNLTPDQISSLKPDSGMRVDISLKPRIYYMGLNQKHPALANPKVVAALRLLINYEDIARTVMRERGKPHQTVVPHGIFAAIDDRPHRFNPPKARQLLAQAGYPEGFRVEMDAFGTIAYDLAQAIQAGFAQAGVEVDIIPGDRKQILTKYRARNHQIFLGEWGSDYLDPNSNVDAFAANRDNGPDARFRTLAWRNSWQDPILTQTTLDAVGERDRDKRAAIYAVIQRRLLTQSPFIILFQGVDIAVSQHTISGLQWGPSFDTNDYRLVRKAHSAPQ